MSLLPAKNRVAGEDSVRPWRLSPVEWAALLALFCVPALVGMARHPLWIDETLTVFPVPVETNSLLTLLQNFLSFPGSIRFTPLYTFLVAVWARTMPATEFVLRWINLPFLIGVAVVSKAFVARLPFRSESARWMALATIALSPFYIYYSFDLRPYAALVCFGGMIMLGLVLLETWDTRAPWLITIGFCLAFLTQPPVVLLAPVLFIALFSFFRRDYSRSVRLWIAPGIVGSIVTAGTGLYYRFVQSAGGMEAWGGGGFAKNVLFIVYEFAGLSGLGPTRAQLRTLAPPAGRASTVMEVHWSTADWLPAALFAVAWLVVFWITAHAIFRHRRFRWWNHAAVRWPATMLFMGGLVLSSFFYFIHYRFLSRHISFLYLPFICLLIAVIAYADLRSTIRLYAILVVGFGISSAQLLFNRGHMREDPRGMFVAWQRSRVSNPSVKLWAFYPVQSVLYYAPQSSVPSLRGGSVHLCERIGSAAYRETQLSDRSAAAAQSADIVSLESPTRDLWENLLQSHRGQRVLIAVNRGTEFDHDGLVRELIGDPEASAVKVAELAFVECFECTVPSR